jgi:hypothetical protein
LRKLILSSAIILFLSISIFSSTIHATVFYEHCNFQMEIQSGNHRMHMSTNFFPCEGSILVTHHCRPEDRFIGL